MNCVIWLLFTLSVVYSHKTEEDVQIRQNRSVHLDCFDKFIPHINRLSSEAKETSINCVNIANAERERELTSIKNIRSELFSEVKRIKETLGHCTSRNDHVGYFECLNGIIEVDRKIVEDISLKSSLYSIKLKKIEEQEVKCFRNLVSKVKDKISNGINDLNYCLVSEDPLTSGEKLNHDYENTGTESPLNHFTSNNFHTTSYPEVRDEDYDYSNNYLN